MNLQIKRLLKRFVEKGDKHSWEEVFKLKQEIIGALNVIYLNLTSAEREEIEDDICEINAWQEYGEDLVYDAEKYYKEFAKPKPEN